MSDKILKTLNGYTIYDEEARTRITSIEKDYASTDYVDEAVSQPVNALADGKVDKNQGTENNGKFLGVVDGYLVLVDAPSGTSGTTDVVRCVAQELTEEQQEQVRANIGAASMTEFSALSEEITESLTEKEASGTADSKVSEHNTSETSHSDIRLLIEGLTTRLNALADSDDTTLDQMSEVVAYIKSNKTLIEAITTNKVSVSDIVDNLTTSASNKPLSAKQGVALKALIDAIVVPKKTSQLTNDSGFLTEHQDISGLAPKATTLSGYGITDGATKEQFNQLSEEIDDQITPSIPEYWQSAYDEAVAKVKALQDAGGKDVVNFLWFSDMHYTPSSTHIKNIGTLCANLMKDLNIPLVLNTGDMMTNGTLNGANDVISYMNEAQDLLSAIPWEMFAYIYGNHDDVYGSYTDGSQTVYYVNKVAPQKMWNSVHRKYARDFKRVYGEHGTYFYIDNIPQKTRFICLNSHFYDGEEITSGTTKYMTTRFGTEQLEWLGNVALNMESDWNNIIAVHVPPTASTINGNTYYLSQYSDGANFRSIIENSTANIIAIVCGHCHADAVVSDDLRCPIITITCAGNFSYASDSEGTRTVGTSTETAIDIVSINKKTSVIYTTRLGVGSDRICSYTGEKIATYSITRNLTGCTSSSSTTVIEEGKTYIETITAIEGYTLDNATVSVTMDGVDISSNYVNGVLTIDSVTGDIVITVTAVEEEQTEPSYTNLFNADNVLLNARSNSSNTIVTANGNFITEWNPLPNDYITEECFLYLKGINPTGGTASSYSKLLFNDAVSDSAVGVGDTIDNVLQFSLTTNAGVNWETLDADELYYKIDLRRVATGELTGAINYSKSFALVLNISSSALTLESLPDIIMSFEPIS